VIRNWSDGRCADCGQPPKPDKEGFLRCKCPDRRWQREAGVEGSAEENAFLKAHGFIFTGDIRGDKYYMGSMDRLVWLYADGTWRANPRPGEGVSFEDYVKASTLEELLAG
jgi:hypothetical protein